MLRAPHTLESLLVTARILGQPQRAVHGGPAGSLRSAFSRCSSSRAARRKACGRAALSTASQSKSATAWWPKSFSISWEISSWSSVGSPLFEPPWRRRAGSSAHTGRLPHTRNSPPLSIGCRASAACSAVRNHERVLPPRHGSGCGMGRGAPWSLAHTRHPACCTGSCARTAHRGAWVWRRPDQRRAGERQAGHHREG